MDFETPPGAATLTVVVAYVPHQQRVNPSQAEIMDELEQLVLDVPRSHALYVLGDFNAQMGRGVDGVTAKWCVRREAPDAAGRALETWGERTRLFALSSRYRPRRRGGAANYVCKSNPTARVQLDYIFGNDVACRAATAGRVRWLPAMRRHGRQFDHALVELELQVKVHSKPAPPRRDFASLDEEETVQYAAHTAKALEGAITERHCELTSTKTTITSTALALARRSTQ
jgi:hypothetical protein